MPNEETSKSSRPKIAAAETRAYSSCERRRRSVARPGPHQRKGAVGASDKSQASQPLVSNPRGLACSRSAGTQVGDGAPACGEGTGGAAGFHRALGMCWTNKHRRPLNVSGLSPKHPERIWAGAAGGGVWQSKDGGQNWASCWNDQDILNIGSLAVDPRNADTIYCGTGEANLSLDSYPGVGLYNSKDAGRTWQLLASAERSGVPSGIGVIAIDPFNSKHLLIGGVGYAEVSFAGKISAASMLRMTAALVGTAETFMSD